MNLLRTPPGAGINKTVRGSHAIIALRRKAVGAILITLGLAGCATVLRDASGAAIEPGEVNVADVSVGDCVVEPTMPGETSEVIISTVRIVPCGDLHDSEVYAIVVLPKGDYPGDDEVIRASNEGCHAEFEDFVGLPYKNSRLEIYNYYPLESSWFAMRGREVTCLVFDPTKQIIGSLRDVAI